jgi:hypothetical protein
VRNQEDEYDLVTASKQTATTDIMGKGVGVSDLTQGKL